jgi:Family of unknown function (DUF5670)
MAIVTRRGAVRAQLQADLTDLHGDMRIVILGESASPVPERGATCTSARREPLTLVRLWQFLPRMGNLLWLIIVILVVMWLAGFAFHVGGGLIHLLLVIAVIVLVVRLLTGRRVV